MVPRHTDAYSLCYSALLMCRFAAPLAFNFMAAIAMPETKGKDVPVRRRAGGRGLACGRGWLWSAGRLLRSCCTQAAAGGSPCTLPCRMGTAAG
jgi:hypothetical protein